MQNKQDRRKTKSKPKASAADLRQLDLWAGGPVASEPLPLNVSRANINNVPQLIDKQVVISEHPQTGTAVQRATNLVSQPVVSTRAIPLRTNAERSLPALTRRQHELLDFLHARAARGLRPPSLTEICRETGLASRGSLHKQVVALVHAGLVEAMNGKQRGVRLIEAANDTDCAVPLLGAIAAGRPIEALVSDETIPVPSWLRGSGACYALRVKGDSMRDAGILDGDVVVIEQRTHAHNGETVVALIDGEAATLKRIEQKPGEIVLHAENPDFVPQRYRPDQVSIQGVVIAALRSYR